MKLTLLLSILLACSALSGAERAKLRLDFIPNAERALRSAKGFPMPTGPDGSYPVEGHGDRKRVMGKDGRVMGAKELALWIMGDARYRRGQPVCLLVCESGKGRDSLAEELSRILGAEVLAPDKKLWPMANGCYIIADENPKTGKADFRSIGNMKHFRN